MDQATSPYEMLGGQDVVAAIVSRFYDLIEQEPDYADLRGMHMADLGPVRESLTGFLTGWLGGPRDWFAKGGCVMSMHRPLAITSTVTAQWIDAMTRAIKDVPSIEPDLSTKLAEALASMARGMISRNDTLPA
jgi:hemoglobin